MDCCCRLTGHRVTSVPVAFLRPFLLYLHAALFVGVKRSNHTILIIHYHSSDDDGFLFHLVAEKHKLLLLKTIEPAHFTCRPPPPSNHGAETESEEVG